MPQIWLTYHELAEQLGCDATVARDMAIAEQWDRKRSRDGLARVKLNGELTQAYLAQAATQASQPEIDHLSNMVADLQVELMRIASGREGRSAEVVVSRRVAA